MLWSEVRELFPDQYVLIEELRSHSEGDKIHVDEVAVIKSLKDPREAWKELFASKDKRFVYHTSNKEVMMEVKLKPVLRRNTSNEG